MTIRIFILLGFLGFFSRLYAQKDTILFYQDKCGIKCKEDSAFYYCKIYRKKKNWVKEVFFTKTNTLNVKSFYSDKACDNLNGTTTVFINDSVINYSMEFLDNHPISKTWYYANGAKKAYMSFDYNITQSWDSMGKELKNTILEKDAKPIDAAWGKYVMEQVDQRISKKEKIHHGVYAVQVNFVVDTLGKIVNVLPLEVPKDCKSCTSEIIEILTTSPNWEPAMKNNNYIPFLTRRSIYFEIANKKITPVILLYHFGSFL